MTERLVGAFLGGQGLTSRACGLNRKAQVATNIAVLGFLQNDCVLGTSSRPEEDIWYTHVAPPNSSIPLVDKFPCHWSILFAL